MRVSLKARLDELNRLLQVSQGVASSLEVSEAVQPVLESAIASGACSARVVLSPQAMPDLDGDSARPVRFGYGPSQNLYRDLDEQILALTRQQDRLVLANLLRPRLLNVAPGAPRPESLLAVALKHENNYYGALWVAYDQPHTFSEEEVRFLVTLGGQAALAAANARLFLNAEIGRRRLESILASSPDPVLVTDQSDRLLLTNPAAWQVLGLGLETDEGKPIDLVIQQAELVELLRATSAEMQSTEINLPGGRIFLATATSVLAEGQRVGRVCVLRDVTHFKELDSLKSEFVSTVSHDLRSPLTLMRGYATMLEMVGQLNEQQTGYVRKIVSGVESMTRLVNNLLDLGRIEAGIGLQSEMVPVQDIVERVVNALQLQAAQKRIQLSADIPSQTIPLIEADQALLQQALHNLVENAIKYTRPEGKVLLRVQTQPIGVVFQVIDNGIGVSPMDLPRLFEKFYRGAQQTPKDERGSGLGLAIVKSIAERHGGRVWAESQLGKGSTFYLAIPPRQP
jgi:PAS domain S-box-containing protein